MKRIEFPDNGKIGLWTNHDFVTTYLAPIIFVACPLPALKHGTCLEVGKVNPENEAANEKGSNPV